MDPQNFVRLSIVCGTRISPLQRCWEEVWPEQSVLCESHCSLKFLATDYIVVKVLLASGERFCVKVPGSMLASVRTLEDYFQVTLSLRTPLESRLPSVECLGFLMTAGRRHLENAQQEKSLLDSLRRGISNLTSMISPGIESLDVAEPDPICNRIGDIVADLWDDSKWKESEDI